MTSRYRKDASGHRPGYHYERRQKNQARIIEALGGVCAECGSSDELEFDHKDPDTKEELGKALKDWSWNRIEAVLWKFQLLCDTCHNNRTVREGHNNHWARREPPPPEWAPDWVKDMTIEDTTYKGEDYAEGDY